ncbi:DUF5703 domain-containing protein [Sphingomonas sp. CLY1604]|uniref:DUF5703 domain-containing protein n=1 Tax=Sphingomonas sp. CLY1604 TaxID=3457786 RepID=UPI003FD7B7F2
MSRRATLGLIGTLPVLTMSGAAAQAEASTTGTDWLAAYNPVWTSQSTRSLDSMPCGGGDIGLNVWVEGDDVVFYMARSGAFDETNSYLKMGRIRLRCDPNPFVAGAVFRQELKLREGLVEIAGELGGQAVKIVIWVEVHAPVIHVEVDAAQPLSVVATYENWRTEDRPYTKGEVSMHRSYIDSPVPPISYRDETGFAGNDVLSYHRMRDVYTVFDLDVHYEGLDAVKAKLWNPLKDLTFGTLVHGAGFVPDGQSRGTYASTAFTGWRLKSRRPAKRHDLRICLHIDNAPSLAAWRKGIMALAVADAAAVARARRRTRDWWAEFWARSRIAIMPDAPDPASAAWRVGRNYQIFRYMLGTNAYGRWPTKFNGGNFTADPEYVNAKHHATPDYRAWGGGMFTAQNQRLVYFPMLKSGDFDMMRPQFEFYENARGNAEIRTRVYWQHEGAGFVEQIENFGLPGARDYGWTRGPGTEPGVEDNPYIGRLWETALEFCLMILQFQQFTGLDITRYIPLVESCLTFFDQHFQREGMRMQGRALDAQGHLIFYPGTAAETYKDAYNSVVTIAGLRSVIDALLALPLHYLGAERRAFYEGYLRRIPPIPIRTMQGHRTIAPAILFSRIQNQEIPQLYPVFPFQFYGIGLPDIQLAIDTWRYGVDQPAQRHYISWHQDNIFCARLGLVEEARDLTIRKLDDATGRRMPTFWGPGHDWVPDHNWGGSGMIGLQEMAMQTVGEAIYLFPAWPQDWDVDIRLHAPDRTIVDARPRGGKIERIDVMPARRRADVRLPAWAT